MTSDFVADRREAIQARLGSPAMRPRRRAGRRLSVVQCARLHPNNEEDRDDSMSDEREARLEKLATLRAAGIEPYPARSQRTHTAAETLAHFDELREQGQEITLTGRLTLLREMGKSAFADIMDGTARIQIYFKLDTIGEDAFRRIKLLDLGDFLQVTGTLFTTRTGEKTLAVRRYAVLSKSLRPLPTKGAGGEMKLSDPEIRHRKRYLDLLANREVEFPIFQARASCRPSNSRASPRNRAACCKSSARRSSGCRATSRATRFIACISHPTRR